MNATDRADEHPLPRSARARRPGSRTTSSARSTRARRVKSVVTLPRGHSPGTYWYHVHLHGLTESQVMGGLSGLLVVEGLKRLLPRSLQHVKERQLAIRNLQTDADHVVLGGREHRPDETVGAARQRPACCRAVARMRRDAAVADRQHRLRPLLRRHARRSPDDRHRGGRLARLARAQGEPPRAPARQALRRARDRWQTGQPTTSRRCTTTRASSTLPRADLARVTVTGPSESARTSRSRSASTRPASRSADALSSSSADSSSRSADGARSER